MTNLKIKFLRQEEALLEKINLNSRPYQRPTEKTYIGKLIDEYKVMGYDRAKPIVLNQNYQVIDGQHRAAAALEFGMIKIPAILYFFGDTQSEVSYYLEHNDWRHPINNKNYWSARYHSGDPLGKLLYDLAEDPECFLCQEVGLQDGKGKFKFTIGQALLLIMYALEIPHTWNRSTYNTKALTKLSHYDYKEIKNTINLILHWTFECFGKDKDVFPHPYKAVAFQAIVDIYDRLYRQHRLATERSYRASVTRFKKFQFTADFLAADVWGKKHMLVNFYNRNIGGKGIKLRLDQ